ncbi:unknown [Ruminococcus sp. CAG:579]|nr:unknown [Ruminococcus sp. CAG:579]
MGEKYENLLGYNIYYLENGEAYPADGVRVTISAERDFTFSLKTDGTSNGLLTDFGSADMTFKTDGSPFYVLCTEAADDSSDNSDASGSSSDVSSDTSSGDASSSNGSSAASSSSSSKSSSGTASSTSPKPNSTAPNDGGSPNTGLGAGIALASLLAGGALAVTAAKSSHEKRDKK